MRCQAVAAAGCYTEGVSQGSGQVLRQESQVVRLCIGVNKHVQRLVQKFGRHAELYRFGVVGQAGQVAVAVIGAEEAGLAVGPCPWEEPQLVWHRHPSVSFSSITS